MDDYIKPECVKSPKNKWALISVLHDGGPNKLSVAKGTWTDQTDGQSSRVIGIRYNGYPGNEKGYPVSRHGNHPIWLIVPEGLEDALIRELQESDPERRYDEEGGGV